MATVDITVATDEVMEDMVDMDTVATDEVMEDMVDMDTGKYVLFRAVKSL
jgi:hypothetical protein